jgi:hypothetical protein
MHRRTRNCCHGNVQNQSFSGCQRGCVSIESNHLKGQQQPSHIRYMFVFNYRHRCPSARASQAAKRVSPVAYSWRSGHSNPTSSMVYAMSSPPARNWMPFGTKSSSPGRADTCSPDQWSSRVVSRAGTLETHITVSYNFSWARFTPLQQNKQKNKTCALRKVLLSFLLWFYDGFENHYKTTTKIENALPTRYTLHTASADSFFEHLF